ncbi:MAG: cytochrome b/b6 domain-containing protein [Hyphomicrobiales bacterium]|nr:cytochrome b/b6 domain-containing protein [Hyphomicrobiales bacterium]
MTPIPRYDPFSIDLHWLVAVAVLATYAIGLGRELVPTGQLRTATLALHLSLGLSVFVLTALRLGWRGLRVSVPSLAGQRWALLASQAMQLALYFALIALPLIGLFSVWAEGRGVSVFGLCVLPSPINADKRLVEPLEDLHAVGAHLMIVLAGLHAAAALVHHHLLRDDTLVRILPLALAQRLRPGA